MNYRHSDRIQHLSIYFMVVLQLEMVLNESEKERYVANLFKHYLIHPDLVNQNYHRSLYKLDPSYEKFVEDPLGWISTDTTLEKKISWVESGELAVLDNHNYITLKLQGHSEKWGVQYDLIQVKEDLLHDSDSKHVYYFLVQKFKDNVETQKEDRL